MPDEFITFVTFWRPQMVRYFMSKGLSQDAEDLTQDLFAGLSVHPASLRLATANRYMWVAALHIAMSARRRDRRLPITFDPSPNLMVDSPSARLFHQVEAATAAPAEDQAIVDHDSLTKELSILPTRERDIIFKSVLDGWTTVELARIAGLSGPRIRQIRDRGLLRLRTARLLADFRIAA